MNSEDAKWIPLPRWLFVDQIELDFETPRSGSIDADTANVAGAEAMITTQSVHTHWVNDK